MIVSKKTFFLNAYTFENGDTLPVAIGYETYGQLNSEKSNAILICHYFSGSSHAAGKYAESDPLPGWWDGVIGPGKPFDTEKYFILCADILCNLNPQGQNIITTGPASIDPETGNPYGLRFPQVIYRDNVKIQRELLKTLGIERLVCVSGPSAGGFQSLEWAVNFPEMVERIIPVVTAGRMNPFHHIMPAKVASDAILADPAFCGGDYYGKEKPKAGLKRALSMMTIMARSHEWALENYGYPPCEFAPQDGNLPVRTHIDAFERFMEERVEVTDANHFLYLTRAGQFFDLGYGYGSLEAAVKRIKAKVLMIPCVSDLFFPPFYSQELADMINACGGCAFCHVDQNDGGHFAGVLEPEGYGAAIESFLNDSYR